MRLLPAEDQPQARSHVVLAWLCVLLVPVGIIAAFLVGQAFASLIGYPADGPKPPLLAALAVTAVAVIVFALPAVIATWQAREASRLGSREGWLPAGVLIVFVAVFLALNLVAVFG